MKQPCDSCNYPVDASDLHKHTDYNLCEICYNSYVGTKVMNQADDYEIYQTIAWIGNRILEEIRKNNL